MAKYLKKNLRTYACFSIDLFFKHYFIYRKKIIQKYLLIFFWLYNKFIKFIRILPKLKGSLGRHPIYVCVNSNKFILLVSELEIFVFTNIKIWKTLDIH